MKKRTYALLTFCWILLLCLIMPAAGQAWADEAYPEGPQVYAEGYFVMDADTGEVLAAKNGDERFYPASITKVLTALVVLENCDNLNDRLTFSKTAFTGIDSHSSSMNPVPAEGETMTVKDALYGLILPSCNASANALAEYVSGSIEDFAGLMNKRAKEIGAVNSNFVTVNGLHNDNHYSTPHDMALIFQEALKNKEFLKIDTTVNYTVPATNKCGERQLQMSHQMVNGQYECEGVYAGKTGRTNEAQRTLLTVAERNGRRVITVIMKSNENQYYNDTKVLMDYGFGRIQQTADEYKWTECNDKVWATGQVNVRELDNPYSTIKGCLTAGQSYERIAKYQNWAKIRFGDGEYYVSAGFLSLTDPATGKVTLDTEPAREPVTEPAPTTAPEISGTEAVTQNGGADSSRERTTQASEKAESGSQIWIWVLLVVLIVVCLCCGAALVSMVIHDRRNRRGRRR